MNCLSLAHASRRPALLGVVGLVLSAGAAGLATPVLADATPAVTYTTPGTYQWTVPAGVTEATFSALGAAGGHLYAFCGNTGPVIEPGGEGAAATVSAAVTPGAVYQVTVGGVGGSTDQSCPVGLGFGGQPGGGNGGFAEFEFGSSGAGGGGYSAVDGPNGFALIGGAGGGAGGGQFEELGAGGAGGAPTGGAGFSLFGPGGGGGGTPTAGGAGGLAGPEGFPGQSGSSLQGGQGGSNFGGCPDGGSGGGGGGGLFGGGGGGSTCALEGSGPGGGGSSGGPSGTTYALGASPDDLGDGAVTISFTAAPPAAPSLGLVTSAPVAMVGQAVTYTATVGGVAGAATVSFNLGGYALPGCGAEPAVGGVATCTYRFPTVGSWSVTASVSGSVGLASDAVTQTVVSAGTRMQITAPHAVIAAGTAQPYRAVLSPDWSSPLQPTGTVSFSRDQAPIAGCQDLPVTATLTWTCTAAFPIGTQYISARYSGDANFGWQYDVIAVTVHRDAAASTERLPAP